MSLLSEPVLQRFPSKKVLLKIVRNSGKHLCQSLFFNKGVGLRPATLLKKRLWHTCFPVNFANFLKAPFPQNTPGTAASVLCVSGEKQPNKYCL